MAGTKEIKRRIKSVKNTKKITKAMELVAASKMKRSVSSALSSRLYAEYSWDVLSSVASNIAELKHPLFVLREKASEEKENILLFIISSNRGLCGAYNAQITKKVVSILKNEKNNINIDIVTIGKKGDAMMRRLKRNIVASFFTLPDNISLRDIIPLSELALNEYRLGKYDRVLIAYTDYVSALLQKPNIKQVVPVEKESLKNLIETLGDNVRDSKITEQDLNNIQSTNKTEYLFEGGKDEFIEKLAEKIIRMQIYQMILESNASEQSARMMAMKNASEAAGEMIDDLTLDFNKARQSNITREISEISAGMASIN